MIIYAADRSCENDKKVAIEDAKTKKRRKKEKTWQE